MRRPPRSRARAERGPSTPRRTSVRLNAVVAALLGVVVVAALPWWRPLDPLTGRVGLLSYAPPGSRPRCASASSREPVSFAPQVWTSWFEWAVPDAVYFVDSRFELFPADVWADYARIAGPGAARRSPLGGDVVVVRPGDGAGPPEGSHLRGRRWVDRRAATPD